MFDQVLNASLDAVCLNPFHVTGLFLYPMKMSENLRFYDVAEVTKRDQWNKMG